MFCFTYVLVIALLALDQVHKVAGLAVVLLGQVHNLVCVCGFGNFVGHNPRTNLAILFLAFVHAWDHSLLPGFGRKFGPNELVSDVLRPGVGHKRRLRDLDKYLL